MAKGKGFKPFGGKESPKEEMAEARQVKSGKVTPKQYAKKEKAEGDKASAKSLQKKGKALASGKLTAAKYAKGSKK